MPRVRFKLKWLMAAVAIASLPLKLELSLLQFSVSEVRSGANQFLWAEALALWAILNLVLAIPLVLLVAIWTFALRRPSSPPIHRPPPEPRP